MNSIALLTIIIALVYAAIGLSTPLVTLYLQSLGADYSRIAVILATTAQLINSLRSVNLWIVFGVIGVLVVIAGLVIERKLEDIKAWRQVMETWE